METRIKAEFLQWFDQKENLAIMQLPTELGAFTPISLFGEDRESFLLSRFDSRIPESCLVVLDYAKKEISFISILSQEERKANPQLEEGFLRIALEIVEALAKTNFSPYESRVLWALLRKTYGWARKEDRISITQFQELTGLDRRNVYRALSNLIKRKIVVRRDNGYILSYGFQKDYTKWIVSTDNSFFVKQRNQKVFPKKEIVSVVSRDNRTKEIVSVVSDQFKPLSVETPTIDNNIKKNNSPNYSADSDEMILSASLLQKIKERDNRFKEPNLQRWAIHIDRLIRIDRRTPEEIRRVIEWCQADSFWKTNILSTAKLREQFSTLFQKMPDAEKYKKAPEETGREPIKPARFKDSSGIVWIMGPTGWEEEK